ncbi:ParB N-terminal domain-containing protein [Actinokineospora globicatena]|uniref:ParB N-terminal domain-containing protein n=1 Tax=Actinokineospora globicatena TaxID=103729 RepID=UPI0020A26FE1|nr:ParB N-terminal domain-containing protein [Actinokineospora globicatena]MCP2300426.1 ParB-like nuclease domain-containing protein [Actinokineospora globicatena]GLW80958.1 chromosome partitioning protein ParB [Actinokineospora globicatena]GLW88151.1 chromosome partitioning protein ParB [Actinokineospora globicatena]
MPRDTGFPDADAEYDFLRARRRQVLARLGAWLRREPDDVNIMLPFDEVVAALGRTGERRLGQRVIQVETIVGSVDRGREFDRRFRPTSTQSRQRWERLARASRRGESTPPIDVYRVGELHFVIDGHHRVSVAHALGLTSIDATVTEITTRVPAEGIRLRGDLITKDYHRVFLDRVPLSQDRRATISLTDPWDYTELSEAVEAWGFRLMQDEQTFLDRPTIARRWHTEEFTPVVEMVRQAAIAPTRTDAEAYLWAIGERYRLIRSHHWDDAVLNTLRTRD